MYTIVFDDISNVLGIDGHYNTYSFKNQNKHNMVLHG